MAFFDGFINSIAAFSLNLFVDKIISFANSWLLFDPGIHLDQKYDHECCFKPRLR